MWDLIIAVLCLYLAYQDARMLIEIPIRDWEISQWLLALVALGLAAVAVWRLIRYYKNSKRKREEEAAAKEEEEAKAALEAEASQGDDADPDDDTDANGEDAANGNTWPMDEEETQIESELDGIDEHDELVGYELLDIKMVVPADDEDKADDE